MRKTLFTALTAFLGVVAVVAQQAPKPAAPKPAAPKGVAAAAGGAADQAKIREAMAGAPADIAKNAAIMDVDAKGQMRQLRAGTNGWTCMPSAGGAAGAAGADPMCLDKSWMGWADAWMHKTDPQIKTMGVAYMLRGDKGASNTDPFATGPTASNQWVVSPPHIMVLLPDPKLLDTMPTDPHGGGAWVMWKGTKYAHLMVPINPVPPAK
jgi:hypothetical protein